MAEGTTTLTPLRYVDSHLSSVMLVGDYGSGKTEVAVNLALRLAADASDRGQVAIADLDLVNPYFRSREAVVPLQQAGLRVVMPRGGHQYADLPILLPEVKGLLQEHGTLSILDVGGDEVGSRVLAALAPAMDPSRHGLWFVVNANRPFTDTADGCLRAIRRIENTTGLRVTGLVSNTHLMEQTTAQMVLQGVALCHEVAAGLPAPLKLVAVMEQLADQLDIDALSDPLLIMRRVMVPPWLRRASTIEEAI